jgi:hypothetical protein
MDKDRKEQKRTKEKRTEQKRTNRQSDGREIEGRTHPYGTPGGGAHDLQKQRKHILFTKETTINHIVEQRNCTTCKQCHM